MQASSTTIATLLEQLEVIPDSWALTPVGESKNPIGDAWQKNPYTKSGLAAELTANDFIKRKCKAIGVLCGVPSGGLLFFDHDGASCDRLIEELSGLERKEALVPTVAVTSGRFGRYQLVYRVPEMFWAAIATKKIKTGETGDDGKPEQVEFRWDGCQSVVIGHHPLTGGYRWYKSPSDIEVAEAPMWMVEQMIQEIAQPQERVQTFRPLPDHDQLGDVEWALSYLEAIPSADDYETWLQVGMALHSASDSLLAEWDSWSRGASNYKPGECDRKWKSFKRSGTGLGTLGMLAKRNGWKMPERLKNSKIVRLPHQEDVEVTVDSVADLRTAVQGYVEEQDPFKKALLETRIGTDFKVRGSRLEKLIDALDPPERREAQTLAELSAQLMEQVELRSQNPEPTGIDSGFYDLEAMTGGFQRSDLIIVAGRPSMGKTAFSLDCAANAARKGKNVVFFSLEMSSLQVTNRLLSAETGIESRFINSGKLQQNQWETLGHGLASLSSLPITIKDNEIVRVEDIREECDRQHAQRPLDMVVIDYLQLMEGDGDNRNAELSRITRKLKALARDFNVPVMCLSQLSRGVEARAVKRPMMSDLRESGAIEQDADLIIMLYRDEYYNPESVDIGLAEIIITKHRNGPVGTVKLLFEQQYTRFKNLARRAL